MSVLRRCQYCGARGQLRGSVRVMVVCCGCRATGPSFLYLTPEGPDPSAIEQEKRAWNRGEAQHAGE